jgi:two-component system, LytTR family, response regulator AlgR
LRVVLVDDEPLARARLGSLLAACQAPPAEIVADLGRGSELLAWLDDPRSSNACDLVLLDIQMPGLDGLALADCLRRRDGPVPGVVFVTAHADHAVEAFELDAVDYLTKPVRLERLQAALARVAQRRSAGSMGSAAAQGIAGPAATASATSTESGAAAALDVLIVNDRGRVVRVPVDDALYLKAELKYVTLRTREHSWLLDESLAELEPRLAGRFVRIHRNALVALRAVRVLERHVVAGPTTADVAAGEEAAESWAVHIPAVDEWLAVSRRQLPSVREALSGRAG